MLLQASFLLYALFDSIGQLGEKRLQLPIVIVLYFRPWSEYYPRSLRQQNPVFSKNLSQSSLDSVSFGSLMSGFSADDKTGLSSSLSASVEIDIHPLRTNHLTSGEYLLEFPFFCQPVLTTKSLMLICHTLYCGKSLSTFLAPSFQYHSTVF